MIWPIRVSQLAEIMACPGSWLLQTLHPEADNVINEAAAEGTAGHEVAADILKAIASPSSGGPRSALSYVGHVASNGVVIDRSVAEAVAEYERDVSGVLHRLGNAQALRVEESVEVIPGVLGGTPDAWIYDNKSNELIVWDLKLGHNPVEAFENWQLLGYLMGLLNKIQITGLADQYLKVSLRIVQPRAPHRLGVVRRWDFIASEARGYFNLIADRCQQVITTDASRTVAGSQCLFCSARAHCETLQKSGAKAIEFSGSAQSIPVDYAAAAVELDLVDRAIELLKSRRSGLREAVEYALKSGTQIREFVLEPKFGRDVWTVPDDDLFIIGDSVGIDLRVVKPLTPTQAKSAGMIPDLVDNLRERKAAGFELVRADQSTARAIFGSNTK